MKRYYELNETGTVLGSYAVPQPDKELTLLEEAPNEESKLDGEKWVPDQEKIDIRLAGEVQIVAKATAFESNLPSWAQVATAVDDISSLAEAKAFLKKLARVVYWLAKDQEK